MIPMSTISDTPRTREDSCTIRAPLTIPGMTGRVVSHAIIIGGKAYDRMTGRPIPTTTSKQEQAECKRINRLLNAPRPPRWPYFLLGAVLVTVAALCVLKIRY